MMKGKLKKVWKRRWMMLEQAGTEKLKQEKFIKKVKQLHPDLDSKFLVHLGVLNQYEQ